MSNLLVNSRVVNYDRKLFIRLAAGPLKTSTAYDYTEYDL